MVKARIKTKQIDAQQVPPLEGLTETSPGQAHSASAAPGQGTKRFWFALEGPGKAVDSKLPTNHEHLRIPLL